MSAERITGAAARAVAALRACEEGNAADSAPVADAPMADAPRADGVPGLPTLGDFLDTMHGAPRVFVMQFAHPDGRLDVAMLPVHTDMDGATTLLAAAVNIARQSELAARLASAPGRPPGEDALPVETAPHEED